jgi:hypothetical protein
MSKHTTGIDASAVLFLIMASALSGFLVGLIIGVSIGVMG